MQYRKFGNTGISISALGFGGLHLPEFQGEDGTWHVNQETVDKMVLQAYQMGVNYFDTAPDYCHWNSEIAIGKAIAPFRDKVYLATKCSVRQLKKPEDLEASLDRSLRKLNTDYVDFYHFWSLNKTLFDEKVVPLKLMDDALKLKEKGKIRHISFSFHDTPEALKHIIDNGYCMESVLLQYNLLDRANEEMIRYASEKGLGVVIMGPVGGGRLAVPTELTKKLGSGNLNTYELALRFVLGNPSVSCALSGMSNCTMVEQNVAVASLETPMSEEQWRTVGETLENLKKFSELYCTGCNYCQPCPKGIEIPKIFLAYTYHNVYGLHQAAKNSFFEYVNDEKNPGATSKDCSNCGMCEQKCPQHLKVRTLLKKVEKELNSL